MHRVKLDAKFVDGGFKLDQIVEEWDLGVLLIGRHIQKWLGEIDDIDIITTSTGFILVDEDIIVAKYDILYEDQGKTISTKLRYQDD